MGQLRVYTRGVALHRKGVVTAIPYDEVTEFTHAATRTVTRFQKENVGLTVRLRFATADGRVVEYTEFAPTVENPEMERVREELGRRMAAVMKQRLDAGESVRWTGPVTFEPDGVAVRRVTRDDELLIDWDDVRLVNIAPCRFQLLDIRSGRQACDLQSHDANFFPGYYLLEERREALEARMKRGADED